MAGKTLRSTKICAKCGETKPTTAEFFYVDRRYTGWASFSLPCKECQKKYEKDRRVAARAAAKALLPPVSTTHRRCKTCKEEKLFSEFRPIKSRGKIILRARCRNCETIQNRAYLRTRYKERRDIILEQNRKWRSENKEKAYASVRRWHKDESNTDARRAICDRYRAKRAMAEGSYTKDDVRELLKEQNRKCYYCGEFLKKFHVDHFIPLARGGTNWASNLVLACEPCNVSKKASMPWDWMPERFTKECRPR